MSIKYRDDIDGLRALAVSSVIIFHVDPSWLPGGFIGVDIFFVISGFLITRIMLSEMEAGRFSFSDFYARRIRRIIPILSVVILFTLILFQFIFTPKDLYDLGWSALASQFFVANFYFAFFSDTSYFADNAHSEALIHLWSLGVEEQFYLLWPVCLFFLYKRVSTTTLIAFVFMATVASFVGGDMLYAVDPDIAYYMLPSRVCQFGSGILVAIVVSKGLLNKLMSSRAAGNGLVLLGIALILWSFWWLTSATPYPGWRAAPPTIGAAFIILGGISRPLASRIFTLVPVVYLGRISYSAYLWHWPIIVLFLYLEGAMSLLAKTLAIVMTLCLSAISYSLIEQPFRRRPYGYWKSLTRMFGVPSIAVMLLCAPLLITNGLGVYALSASFKEAVDGLSIGMKPNYQANYVCQKPLLTAADLDDPRCITGDQNVEPTAMLWGDSKAAQYAGLIGEIGKAIGISIRNLEHSACPPVFSNPERFTSGRYARTCKASGTIAMHKVLEAERVVISASWRSYLSTGGDAFEIALRETLDTLKRSDIKVAVLGDVPPLLKYDRECYVIRLKTPLANCSERARVAGRPDRVYNDRIKAIAEKAGALYIDFNDLLCDNQYCHGERGGRPLYYDAGHLSINGSVLVGKEVVANKDKYASFLQWLKD
ncbi:hypothetical protein CSC94_05805 [Zhengella mangrovi]|uniref:Acyltransferase n=1 Tax=Zhengella mangrovi TaxID=1982044 RepID=A0A2G1QRT2_9HYPH|nr:acyltransferase family protein [Zhengella mangrovi]PHP68164.1 hypothetical protein CSC94_05805 [Zhengella mangrovi]